MQYPSNNSYSISTCTSFLQQQNGELVGIYHQHIIQKFRRVNKMKISSVIKKQTQILYTGKFARSYLSIKFASITTEFFPPLSATNTVYTPQEAKSLCTSFSKKRLMLTVMDTNILSVFLLCVCVCVTLQEQSPPQERRKKPEEIIQLASGISK